MTHSPETTTASHPSTHLSLGVAIVTAVLTVGFHFLIGERQYGVAFALFILLLVVGMHVIAALAGREGNRWAYLFLAPVFFSTLAEVLYANGTVRVLGFMITFVSLAFFSYWLTAPRTPFREVGAFWSSSFFLESILPIEGGSGIFKHWRWGRHGSRVATGTAIALPFLLIFGALFIAADGLFRKSVGSLFENQSFAEIFLKVIRDLVVAWYLGRAGWSMLTRAIEERRANFSSTWIPSVDHVIFYTFLGLLNALFLVFIVFQFIYFFGGQDYVQAQGLTYADYARGGFFELLAVAGLVFCITWTVYFVTGLRDLVMRILMSALVVQTGIVIISAISRMSLYIETYGLTVSRWWVLAILSFIGVVLFSFVLGGFLKASYSMMIKLLTIGTLSLFSIFLLVNVEGTVVQWNADRFLSGKTKQLDLTYFTCLSTDAVPAMVDLMKREWPEFVSAEQTFGCWSDHTDQISAKAGLLVYLTDLRLELQKKASLDWRNLVIADYRALAVMGD